MENEGVAYLVDDVTQYLVLVVNSEFLGFDDFGFQGKQHHGVIGCALRLDPVASRVELCAHRFDVFAERR